MNYRDWIEQIPESIRQDSLWKQEVYRLSLFASDLSWRDATRLGQDARRTRLAAQLFDAVGSIAANLSEGYSRGHRKDRARFYEYALGSAREARTWYYVSRHLLGDEVAEHRIELQAQVIRLLLTMLPGTRGHSLHEGFSLPVAELTDDGSPPPSESTSPLVRDVP